MIEKPDLPDEKIVACLHEGFEIDAHEMQFLPLGNDSSAWVYRVQTGDGTDYFLKIKKGPVYEPALSIPRFLYNQGIQQVVAPLPAQSGELWKSVDGFALILYPFIAGKTGMEMGMTNRQWTEFGRILKKIHESALPPDLLRLVQKETFSPRWNATARELDQQVNENAYQRPLEKELALFWKGRSAEIRKIVDRAEELGQMLQKFTRPKEIPQSEAMTGLHETPAGFVLCHSDIHTANILLDADGALHMVDWDQPLLAPKERDLMFVAGTPGESGPDANQEQRCFFSGFGETVIDPLALAYYRYEWVVQEIGDFGERVFLMAELGEETKKAAVEGFCNLFNPGDVVDGAYRAEQSLR